MWLLTLAVQPRNSRATDALLRFWWYPSKLPTRLSTHTRTTGTEHQQVGGFARKSGLAHTLGKCDVNIDKSTLTSQQFPNPVNPGCTRTVSIAMGKILVEPASSTFAEFESWGNELDLEQRREIPLGDVLERPLRPFSSFQKGEGLPGERLKGCDPDPAGCLAHKKPPPPFGPP